MAQTSRKHIAVVGQQRTGTTALRQCLGTAPGYFDLGEIFSIHATELQVSWWGWLAQQAAAAPVSVCPTSWQDGWADYLSAQREQSGARHFVFDLKAEFMGNTLLSNEDGPWFFFRTDDVVFVHIERKNLVAQIVSRLRAESTREWAWRDSEADATMKARHSRSFERRGGEFLGKTTTSR